MIATPIAFLLALLATASAETVRNECSATAKGDLYPKYGTQYVIHVGGGLQETDFVDLTTYDYPCNPENHPIGQPIHVGTILTACEEGYEAPYVALSSLTKGLVVSSYEYLPVNITAIVTCKPLYPSHS